MAVEWDDLPRPNLLTWVAEVEQSVQARALPERVQELGEWLDHRLPRPRGPRQFVARPCDASGVVGRLRKGPMRPGPRREGAHGRRSCPKKLFVCRLTCLPQVCQGKRHGFERMQKVADDTTQHCHRLAVTQPACPTLAPPPPPRNPFAAGVDKWWGPPRLSLQAMQSIAATSGYGCASPAEGLSDS